MLEPGRAEVEFAVTEDYQGRGLATLLLARLAELAVARGIPIFEAEVLPASKRMLQVLRDSEFPPACG
jgi:GNAT superfamily N-acetyltransferase